MYGSVKKTLFFFENLDNLETGDLLLYHGVNSCLDTIIEKFSKSKYSHCAIVLKNPTSSSYRKRPVAFMTSGCHW